MWPKEALGGAATQQDSITKAPSKQTHSHLEQLLYPHPHCSNDTQKEGHSLPHLFAPAFSQAGIFTFNEHPLILIRLQSHYNYFLIHPCLLFAHQRAVHQI